MINKLLKIVALLCVQNHILLLHVVANVVVNVAQWFRNWNVHLFNPPDRSYQIFQIL